MGRIFYQYERTRARSQFPQQRCNVVTTFSLTTLLVSECDTHETVPQLRRLVARFSSYGRFRAKYSPCGICGARCGSGTGFAWSIPISPCQYDYTLLHIYSCIVRALPLKEQSYIVSHQRKYAPNGVVEWLALMLRIREVPTSNLSSEIGYHD
jgi:hypothetical protein